MDYPVYDVERKCILNQIRAKYIPYFYYNHGKHLIIQMNFNAAFVFCNHFMRNVKIRGQN